MRYFDFHTHAFADAIAERAMASLTNTTQNSPDSINVKPVNDGTFRGLKETLESRGIWGGLLLPIATKPHQQHTINTWAAEVSGGNIISCGTVHPDAEDALEELDRIKELGSPGVKFHSEYQFFAPDEERVFPIYRKMADLGLFAVFHGGWDPYAKGEVLATPKSFANLAEKFPELTIVAAHMGGINCFDETEEVLAGKYPNVYFDTGVMSKYIGLEQFYRLIKMQGADKVLFASDLPWDDPQNEIDMINAMPLTEEEKELIFHENAESLLKLRVQS